MKNRIKEIRKDNSYTMAEFGAKIGTAANTISNYESGIRIPSNAVVVSICKEFNVNEEWLRTGAGEKYVPQTDNQKLLAYINRIAGENDSAIKRMLVRMASLSPSDLEIVEKAIDLLLKNEQ